MAWIQHVFACSEKNLTWIQLIVIQRNMLENKKKSLITRLADLYCVYRNKSETASPNIKSWYLTYIKTDLTDKQLRIYSNRLILSARGVFSRASLCSLNSSYSYYGKRLLSWAQTKWLFCHLCVSDRQRYITWHIYIRQVWFPLFLTEIDLYNQNSIETNRN